jgi:hypothetical protein
MAAHGMATFRPNHSKGMAAHGMAAHHSNLSSTTTTTIHDIVPKTIFSYWEGEEGEFVLFCIQTWHVNNPSYKIHLLKRETLPRDWILPKNFDVIAVREKKLDHLHHIHH